MNRAPPVSMRATSPVRSQACASIVAAVASGVVQVAGHRRRSAQPQLARRAWTEVGAGQEVDDPGLHAGQQLSGRAGRGRGPEIPDRGGRGDLGHAVALQDRAAEPVRTGLLQLRAERSGPAAAPLQRRQVVSVDRRVLGQGQHDRRHHDHCGDAVLLDEPEERLDVEARHRHHRRSTVQAAARDHAEPDGMEEGGDGE